MSLPARSVSSQMQLWGACLLAIAIVAGALAGRNGGLVAGQKGKQAETEDATQAEHKSEPAPESNESDAEHAEKMAQGIELFKQKVRPVLVARCVKCHGGETTENEFDLTTREGFLKGGVDGPVVALGRPTDSRLYKLIAHLEEPHMPDDGAKLSDQAIAHIGRWIELGAPYDRAIGRDEKDPQAWIHRTIDPARKEYWAFQPLVAVPLPDEQAGDDPSTSTWSQTPIDRFVLAALRERGLTPNEHAARRDLIRRAYFDLIGLPPTSEEVDAFLNDTAPDAYERLLDRLLANPHYGERWGRHWLDVARFAESHGFEQDYDRPYAYHFRDFVIRALNADMPYDQFVQWQLAGDEIAPDEPLAMMATGFLGSGVFPTQITANEVERTRYDAIDDMAATTGTAMLGLTIGCARCHDHKFDPIPQADYYRFASTFTTTVRSDIELNLDPEPYRKAKAAFDREHRPLVEALKKFEADDLPARFRAWEASGGQASLGSTWVLPELVEFKSQGGATLTKLDDGSLLASGTNPDFDVYTVAVRTSLVGITGIRLEALSHSSMVKGGPGRADNGNIALSDFSVIAAPQSGGDATPVTLADPKATFEQQGLPIAATIDSDEKSAWAIDPQFGRDHAAVYETRGTPGGEGGTRLTFTLKFNNNNKHNIGRLRISLTTAPQPLQPEGSLAFDAAAVPEAALAALAIPANDRTPEQTDALLAWYRTIDPEWRELHGRVEEHLAAEPKPSLTKVMVVSEGLPPMRHHTQGADFFNETYYLNRGDTDQKIEPAQQSFLQVLTNAPDGAAHWHQEPPEGWRTSYRRRSLADWITDTEYGPGQLLARVIVNRLWQHHLGRGIVATPNDFGVQGELPTHPELLDLLAARLMASGWRLKTLHRQIMTSAAYMQSSAYDDDAAIDPENRYLWRYEPRRVEAEIVRDAMLAVSGSLDTAMYGPGTLDEGHRRRSIYFMIKRSKLIPFMQIFDAPEPLVSIGARPSTTIAPQALLFMNNPHVREYAGGFARRIDERADGSLDAVVRTGYEVALSREPSEQELSDALAFLDAQSGQYAADGKSKDEARHLALTDWCQVLMCLSEFIYAP